MGAVVMEKVRKQMKFRNVWKVEENATDVCQ
jgi:hypothetical protein